MSSASIQQAGPTQSIPVTASIPVTTSIPAATSAPVTATTHQNTATSVSAVNQVAPNQTTGNQAPKQSNKMIPAIIGIAVLIAAIVVAVIFFTLGGSSSDDNSEESSASRQVTVEAETPASAATPTFGTPTASSVLTGDIDPHDASYAVDNNTTTAWIEGVPGTGEGSWLEFKATSLQSVHSISIMSGFCKSESLYYKNSRPKEVTISFSDGSSTTQTLQDQPFAWQTITLENTVQTESVKITINSTYHGSKYEDTCISEVLIQ